MTDSGGSAQDITKRPRSLWRTPHRIALAVVWLVATVFLIVTLANGVRRTRALKLQRDLMQAGYVAVLMWALVREGPALTGLPAVEPVVLKRRKAGRYLPAVVLLLLLTMSLDGWEDLIPLLMMVAVLPLLIIWRRDIRLRTVLIGLALAVVALLGGLPFYLNGAMDVVTLVAFAAFTVPMFIAGDLLIRRAGVGASPLHGGQIGQAALSFLKGCLLFVPLGLANAAGGAPGPWMTWVDRPWIPLTQPWFSGITEEVWYRLFLVSLCVFLLRPAFRRHQANAIAFACFFSAITFGMGHGGRWLDRFAMTGLLYGLPMAVTYARTDIEHAIGAHYMINMIPTLMVFLEGR